MQETALRLLDEHIETMHQLKVLAPKIEQAAHKMLDAVNNGGTIFWMGNGGSAAASMALTTDSSILTCLSNDYDYSIIFSRQLEALCGPHDVVIGITTSGNSRNVLEGVKTAKQKGAYTIGLSGHQGGMLAEAVDLCLTVPSNVTARIQEGHIFVGHTMCELVEHAVAKQAESEKSEVS
jgi:D-sedoheptulose 7-phosphate isomerase